MCKIKMANVIPEGQKDWQQLPQTKQQNNEIPHIFRFFPQKHAKWINFVEK